MHFFSHPLEMHGLILMKHVAVAHHLLLMTLMTLLRSWIHGHGFKGNGHRHHFPKCTCLAEPLLIDGLLLTTI